MTGPDMPFRPAAHRPRRGFAQEPVDIQPRRVSRRRRPRVSSPAHRLWAATGLSLLLVALTAGALAWWTGPPPESQPEAVVRADLARQGLGGIGVTAQGRHVHLAGTLPPGVTADFAVALARGATCTAFGIARPCAEKVSADLRPGSTRANFVTSPRPAP
jgi:hypothetical protein